MLMFLLNKCYFCCKIKLKLKPLANVFIYLFFNHFLNKMLFLVVIYNLKNILKNKRLIFMFLKLFSKFYSATIVIIGIK